MKWTEVIILCAQRAPEGGVVCLQIKTTLNKLENVNLGMNDAETQQFVVSRRAFDTESTNLAI